MGKRGPAPTGDKALSGAERQARYRDRHAGEKSERVVVKFKKPGDRRGRAQRWLDAVAELTRLQSEYADWLEGLPENLEGSPTAEALQAMVDFDLEDLAALAPPRGFGRD